MLSTPELKTAYRKGIERLKTEQDPLRRHLLLQMTYAIKVDLARRIKFKGAKKSLWKQVVDTFRIAKVLNRRYIADHELGVDRKPSVGGPNEEDTYRSHRNGGTLPPG